MKVRERLAEIADDHFLQWEVKRAHNAGWGVKQEPMYRVRRCIRMLEEEIEKLRPLVKEEKGTFTFKLVVDWLPMCYDPEHDIAPTLIRCAEMLDEIHERIDKK